MRKTVCPIFIICAGKTDNWNVLIVIALTLVRGENTIAVLVWNVTAALSYEVHRQLDGIVEADEIYQTAGNKGQSMTGGSKELEHLPRKRGKKQPPGRGHYEKDSPAIIAWVSRNGYTVLQVVRDFTIDTVQKAANIAVKTGSVIYTDSAKSYAALIGYIHDSVNHSQREYARGEVHENRAENTFSLLRPFLAVFRGVGKANLPGYIGFFQFLRNFRNLNAIQQAEMILYAALDPSIAGTERKGEFVMQFDHFQLLHTQINWAFPESDLARVGHFASRLCDYGRPWPLWL